ncbi:MAG TPA: hypothetical protein VJR02_12510 [Pyrinomonadaceae bacterium]|nr:hypothetical protein [Pyrinomonadaceae bacterium]
MSKPSLDQIKATLVQHVEGFFNSQTDLAHHLWDTYLGLYYKDKPDSLNARFRSLGLSTPFFSKYDTTPVSITDLDNFTKVAVNASGIFGGKSYSQPEAQALLQRRVDLVLDSKEEMLASKFPFYEVATRLSRIVREKIYRQPLANIRLPDKESDQLNYNGFFTAAAQDGTYDHTNKQRDYYQKWKVKETKDPADREYKPENLSDDYIKLNFIPLELQRDRVYLFLEFDDIRLIFKVFFNNSRRGRVFVRDLLNLEGITNDRDILKLIVERYDNLLINNQTVTPPPSLTFLYSFDGSDGSPDWLTPTTKIPGGLVFPDQEVIDSRYHVKQLWNIPFEGPDPANTIGWTYQEWVQELVRLKFSDSWVWLRDNPYGGRNTPRPPRNPLFLDEMRSAAADPKNPLRQQLLKFIRLAEEDKNLYLVPRGSRVAATLRLVGADQDYVYLYHKTLKLIIRIKQEMFFEDYFAIGVFAKVIYRNSEGLIPLSKIVVWGGLAVMSFVIIGPAIIAERFRAYVLDRLSSVPLKRAAQETIKKFRTDLVLMFANVILGVFPTTHYTAMVRGFLTGYTTDTFEALISKWGSLIDLEPTSLKIIKTLSRIQAAVNKVDDTLSKLKSSVDENSRKLLEDRFVKFILSMWSGSLLLAHNLYYLEYEQVKVLLDLFAKLGDKPPINQQEWDRLRHRHLLLTLTNFDKELKSGKKQLVGLYSDVQGAVQLAQKALRLASVAFVANKATGGMLTDWVVLVPGIGIFAATHTEETGKAISKTAGLLYDQFVDHNYTPQEMEKLGELLGRFFGAMMINKKIFGKGMSTRDRWKFKNLKRRVDDKLLTDELGLSFVVPMIKLVLFHYVLMVEGVLDATKKVWNQWDALQDEIEIILWGKPENWDVFPPEDEVIDLRKIGLIVTKLIHILVDWLQELAKVPQLQESMVKMTTTLKEMKNSAPLKMPKLQEIIDGKFDGEGWSRDALGFIMLASLHAALQHFAEALIYFSEQVHAKGSTPVSLGDLLALLEFKLSAKEATDILDRNMDDLVAY